MLNYNVDELAGLLSVSEETVRRWIRSGKLKAEKNSCKEGFVISQTNFVAFAIKHPKYNILDAGGYDLMQLRLTDLQKKITDIDDMISHLQNEKIKYQTEIYELLRLEL